MSDAVILGGCDTERCVVMCTGGGRLPLHIAVDRNNPSVEVVRAVIRGYPGTYMYTHTHKHTRTCI